MEYQYTLLAPGHSEIRLIRLQPGPLESEIHIEIFHALISSKPVYEALSYTWGCPDKTQVLHVRRPDVQVDELDAQDEPDISSLVESLELENHQNNKSTFALGVAQNLFDALQNLRYHNGPRVLWIDAICINQNDVEERSSEVLKMGSIYKNACLVIVWLGPSSHNSDLALQTLERIGEGVIQDAERHSIIYRPGSWAGTLRNDTEALISRGNSWFAIKDLLTRDWFSRLWVFQEICLAEKASIVIGQSYLDWKIATDGLEWVWMIAGRLDRYFDALEINKVISNIRYFLLRGCSPTTITIFDALNSSGDLRCSDPRDRLFAIRSLLDLASASLIVPDYSLGVEDVYTNFAKQWIVYFGTVNFLSQSQSQSQSLLSSNLHLQLPSWVPDWSQARKSRDGLATAQCTGSCSAFWNIGDGNNLGVEGVLVGKIGYVTPPAEAPATDDALRELCRSWMKLVLTNDPATEGSPVEASFLGMIVGGFVSEQQPSAISNYCGTAQVKAFLNNTEANRNEFVDARVAAAIQAAIRGRSFFVTVDGDFGLGPESAQMGDCIAVILSCDYPLILRQAEVLEHAQFRIVGYCYAPEIMFGEALLGPLAVGWSARLESIQGDSLLMLTNGNIRTLQDPRLPPLSPDWRYRYGDWEAPEEIEAKELKDMKEQWFENVETGKKTWFDPRLTPELLKARGVAVETIVLV